MNEQFSPQQSEQKPPASDSQLGMSPSGDHMPQESSKRAWLWWLVGGIVVLAAAIVLAVVMLLKNDSTSIVNEITNTSPNSNTTTNTNTNTSNDANTNTNVNANKNTNTSVPTSANRLLDPSALTLSAHTPNGRGYEVYDIDLGGSDVKKVFSNDDANVLDASSGSIFYHGVSANTGTLFRFDLNTDTSEALVALTGVHSLWGVAVNPSETAIAYTDRCGFECADAPEKTTTVVKLMDLSTKTEKELSRSTGETTGFKMPTQWLDEDTLLLRTVYEGSDGPVNWPEVYLLETKTGVVTPFTLDRNAITYAPALDGTGIVFTTFVYDSDSKASSSSVVLNRFDGTSKVLAVSSTMHYDEPRWLSTDQFAVRATKIESVRNELGYIVEGTRELDVMTVSTGALSVHKQKGSFEELVYGYGDEVYYTDYSKSAKIYTLRRYNLKTGVDSELSLAGPNWIRFLAATLDGGK